MQNYMLIDVTTVPDTRFLAIGKLQQVVLMGKLAQANGMTVIAPPLEGRGFSKLEKEQPQYLLWNATQIPPPEDYSDCLRALLAHAEKLPVDATPVSVLQDQVDALYPNEAPTASTSTPSVPREPRAPGAPAERPKGGSTTGRVWDIADRVYVAGTDWKTARTAIIAACTAEGINEATAATQYSKWKAAKIAAAAA